MAYGGSLYSQRLWRWVGQGGLIREGEGGVNTGNDAVIWFTLPLIIGEGRGGHLSAGVGRGAAASGWP